MNMLIFDGPAGSREAGAIQPGSAGPNEAQTRTHGVGTFRISGSRRPVISD